MHLLTFRTKCKSDIENFKWLLEIEDDEGIGGKCTCVQLIDINKELFNWFTTVFFRLVLGKEKLNILGAISDVCLVV